MRLCSALPFLCHESRFRPFAVPLAGTGSQFQTSTSYSFLFARHYLWAMNLLSLLCFISSYSSFSPSVGLSCPLSAQATGISTRTCASCLANALGSPAYNCLRERNMLEPSNPPLSFLIGLLEFLLVSTYHAMSFHIRRNPHFAFAPDCVHLHRT